MHLRSVIKITLGLALMIGVASGGAWADASGQPAPKLVIEQSAFEFEPVVDGAKVSHDFVVRNEGDAVLNVNKVKTG